jgi:Trk-type K+ transport system membrane component
MSTLPGFLFTTTLRAAAAVREALTHYYFTALLALVVTSVLGGAAIFSYEAARGRHVTYLASFYTAVSAVTETGFLAIDPSTLSGGSASVIFVLMLFGGSALGAAFMPLVRWWNVRAALAARAAAVASGRASVTDAALERQLIAGRELLRDSLWLGFLVTVAYCAAIQVLLFFALVAYTVGSGGARAILAARGVDAVWFSAFHAVSVFNNCGYTLFTDNMSAFADDRTILLLFAAISVLGNVGAPIGLRAALRAGLYAFPASKRLRFLLRHPRVAFHNVFDADATRQLAFWIFLFTVYQFVSFMATEYSSAYLRGFEPATRVLIAFYSSVATRSSGFNVVNIGYISASQAVVCAYMSFLAATPVLAALRSAAATKDAEADELQERLAEAAATGTVELQPSEVRPVAAGTAEAAGTAVAAGALDVACAPGAALGGAAGSASARERAVSLDAAALMKAGGTVAERARSSAAALLDSITGESPLLLVALLVMCYADDELLSNPASPHEFSVFGFAFELLNAYGSTGYSLSQNALSTSGYLTPLSQLVVITAMFAGRMRGLPLDADGYVGTYSLWAAGESRGRREIEPDVVSGFQSDAPSAASTVNDDHAFTTSVDMFIGRKKSPNPKSLRASVINAF